MPELIERDALKNHLYQAQAEAFKRSEWYVAGAIQSFIDILDKQPTLEAEPVRHGRWDYRHEDDWCYCTACGTDAEGSDGECLETDYCQHCGARMDATDTNVCGKGGADNG